MVEIIPKEEKIVEKESIFVRLFFWLSIFLFILSVSLFLLFHSQTKKVEAELKVVKDKLEKLETPQQKKLKKDMYNYKRKIDDFSYLLKKHRLPSKIFEILERNIHSNIQFTSFEFSSEQNQLILKGRGRDLTSLAEQILIFEKLPSIDTLNLSEVELGKGGDIKFNLLLNIRPDFLVLK